MIPPTSIDGTDITGATIDGTDVTEITIDGQTVFSAGPSNLPVAYSNLVAWYPFDSAEYGGSNADDVTAIIGGSGDDTAYNGTVNGATYQSSGGVNDINAGANSGGFDFDGSNDFIQANPDFGNFSAGYTFTGWFNSDDNLPNNQRVINIEDSGNDAGGLFGSNLEWAHDDGSTFHILNGVPVTTNTWTFFAATWDGSTVRWYIDASETDSQNISAWEAASNNSFVVNFGFRSFNNSFYDGQLDDLRFYNRALTGTEVTDIYNATKP